MHLREQAEVDTKNDRGETALWMAAANGHVGVVKVLIGAGKADIEALAKPGKPGKEGEASAKALQFLFNGLQPLRRRRAEGTAGRGSL